MLLFGRQMNLLVMSYMTFNICRAPLTKEPWCSKSKFESALYSSLSFELPLYVGYSADSELPLSAIMGIELVFFLYFAKKNINYFLTKTSL
jgi:hypothetical protein